MVTAKNGLPKAKNLEFKAAGQGYNPAFAEIFTWLRPGTGVLRDLGSTLLLPRYPPVSKPAVAPIL